MRAAAPGGSVQLPDHRVAPAARPWCGGWTGPGAGRPQADPRDRELARLHKQMAKLELELDKAKKVIEIQSKLSALLERSRRCCSSALI